jgi:hypothetical protein
MGSGVVSGLVLAVWPPFVLSRSDPILPNLRDLVEASAVLGFTVVYLVGISIQSCRKNIQHFVNFGRKFRWVKKFSRVGRDANEY